jgi:hypothetical protein
MRKEEKGERGKKRERTLLGLDVLSKVLLLLSERLLLLHDDASRVEGHHELFRAHEERTIRSNKDRKGQPKTSRNTNSRRRNTRKEKREKKKTYRLVSLLLLVRTRAMALGLLLPLCASKLIPALSALCDARHPLLVVLLDLLPRPHDVALVDEAFVGLVERGGGGGVLLLGLEQGELPFGGGATAVVGGFGGGLETEGGDEGKVGRGEDLERKVRSVS